MMCFRRLQLAAVIKDDPECLAMFREAMKEKTGPKPSCCNNVTETDGQATGNSRAYSIDRVKRECEPEVVAKVMAGQMSPNAANSPAAMQAGISISVVALSAAYWPAWWRACSSVRRQADHVSKRLGCSAHWPACWK